MITIIPFSLKVLGRRESERSTQWRFLELWPACEVQTATDEALFVAFFYFTIIQQNFYNLLPPLLKTLRTQALTTLTSNFGLLCLVM